MKRRQMLIGTGTMLATGLAGYSSAALAHDSEDKHTKAKKNGHKKRDSKKHNEDDDYEGIPGFDREEFELDSDVLHVKELAFHKGTLELSVIVETTDGDVLAEELQALVPAFNQAIREADAEEFFEAVEEFKFALYDECDVLRAALYLDIEWLRECLFGDLTTEEFVNRILMILGVVGDGPEGNNQE